MRTLDPLRMQVLLWSRFVIGLLISALGSVLTIRANLGISPWDVLHDGVSQRTPFTFGTAVIAVSVVVIGISWAVGIVPSLGTIVNVILIGAFVDLLLWSGIAVSVTDAALAVQVLVLVAGVALIGFGAAVYIGAGLGAGPRDSLQLALSLRGGLRPGVARVLTEGSAVVVGWLLGGAVGVGTVVSVLLIGVAVDLSFAVLRVDPAGRRVPAPATV